MEIDYLSTYDGESRPQAVKRISSGPDNFVDTPIAFEFANEVDNFTEEDIYAHLENLVKYIQDTSLKLSPIGLEEEIPEDGWHLKGGWAEIQWANDEAFKWWNYIYYKDEQSYSVAIPPEFIQEAE